MKTIHVINPKSIRTRPNPKGDSLEDITAATTINGKVVRGKRVRIIEKSETGVVLSDNTLVPLKKEAEPEEVDPAIRRRELITQLNAALVAGDTQLQATLLAELSDLEGLVDG